MKRKILWLLVSSLMALSLVLVSCAPAVTEEEEEVVVEEEEEEEKKEEVVEEEEEAGSEVPKYGGWFVYALDNPKYVLNVDRAMGGSPSYGTIEKLYSDPITAGDWARGPAGTNEFDWVLRVRPAPEDTGCYACESWEVDGDNIVYHIRKGVYFQNKPPVNGREMTAEDVAYTLRRMYTSPKGWFYRSEPWKLHFYEREGQPWIEATDKYTVVVHTLPGMGFDIFQYIGSGISHYIIAPEMVEKWGGSLEDWRSACGVGPFMLVDALPGSSWTFERHPNYWMKDPVGPGKGNQLPYLDGVKLLEVYDPSTRLAAMRTGKIAWLQNLLWEDADGLKGSNPELISLSSCAEQVPAIHFRLDKPELPQYDLRVRQALLMAVDKETIATEYYRIPPEQARDSLLTVPIIPNPIFDGAYLRLDEYPEDVQELFEYHPDKARELLVEAGYPNGFKLSVLCEETQVDILSIVAAYWADIGVDLTLDVKEYSVYTTIGRTKKEYEETFSFPGTGTIPWSFQLTKPGVSNYSCLVDPYLEEVRAKVDATNWDMEEKCRLYKEMLPYYQRLCMMLQLPGAPTYQVWWPWLKNYHGEREIGYDFQLAQTRWVWIDQDMKEAMTGVR